MARLDTGWHAHPKILKLGLAAMGLHAWSISYCDFALSDGFIPAGAWPALPGNRAAVFALLRAGLWRSVEGGYQLHDYTDYNRTKAEVGAYMAAKVAAGQAGGRASAQARAQANGQQPLKQTGKQNPTPGPGSNSVSSQLSPAGSSGWRAAREGAREATDPKLLADHLERLSRERASRTEPGQPDSKHSLNGEMDDAQR